jgi:hypothetical protein
MANSLTANVPYVCTTSPSPSHRDARVDPRRDRGYAQTLDRQEGWSTGLDSILDEYADLGPSDHNVIACMDPHVYFGNMTLTRTVL